MAFDVKTFDPAKINAFLNQKWLHYKCEVCGVNDWNFAYTEDYPVAGLISITKEGNISGAFWATLAMSCQNCGNTKQIMLDVVDKWLASEEGQRELANLPGRDL